jgi:hypothetical protein
MVGLVLLLAAVLGNAATVRPVFAGAGVTWQATAPVAGLPLQLYTTAGGAVFVRTSLGLFRSDDSGQSWSVIDLPPFGARIGSYPPSNSLLGMGPSYVAVDPQNPDRLFVGGDAGLFRRLPDGSDWELVLPNQPQDVVQRVAISAANRQVVYLASRRSTQLRLLRSDDGGDSWNEVALLPGGACPFALHLLQPHPQETERVFRYESCQGGGGLSTPQYLRDSHDGGRTWENRGGWPTQLASLLVGGTPAQDGRLYLATFTGASNASGSRLLQSDDDGLTWHDVGEGLWDTTLSVGQRPSIRGLALDPHSANVLYVALARSSPGVWQSVDGGHEWTALGLSSAGFLIDLMLSTDGRRLYAATDQGVWTLAFRDPATKDSDQPVTDECTSNPSTEQRLRPLP